MSFEFETICDDFLVIFKLRPAKCALENPGGGHLACGMLSFSFASNVKGSNQSVELYTLLEV